MEEIEFDINNFNVKISNVVQLSNIILLMSKTLGKTMDYNEIFDHPIEEHDFTMYPYVGLSKGELTFFQVPYNEVEYNKLPVLCIKYKFMNLMPRISEFSPEVQPLMGDYIYASVLGQKFKKVMFVKTEGHIHYCVDLDSPAFEQLESGQMCLRLTRFKHIKPRL